MSKIKIGIIGAGGILEAHAPGFNRLKDKCELIVADPNPNVYPRVRQLFGEDVEIVSDYKEILEREDIKAVDILLPHYLHEAVTVEAAERGKHVLIEKVMARTVEECDRMIEACDRAGVTLTVCHDRRYDGDWMALKNIIDSGELGEIRFWKLEHNQNVYVPEGNWIRSKEKLGGGAIMSCLTHQIDGLRWYAGEVESVTSMTQVDAARMEGESIGAILARMRSGALAMLSINWQTQSNHSANGLWYELNHVTGTKGEAYYLHGKGTFVKIYGGKSSWVADSDYTEDGFSRVKADTSLSGHQVLIEEWLKSLTGEAHTITTDGASSRLTVEVAEAAYISEEQKRVIAIS
ncbi:Gfo/Idh/MocA family protein [Paenibacillus agaridevorans]|uniref:Gfo/Idh/MocA family protein n=1 Tax=Paenibacillus agaridevorans TaxID=171404 RepID=UPI001BE49F36|nr:Gfo/Idh/MocA family oxidoreductase [Paenibacillus agaridevorans]